jgi:hypothetical protein
MGSNVVYLTALLRQSEPVLPLSFLSAEVLADIRRHLFYTITRQFLSRVAPRADGGFALLAAVKGGTLC